MSDHIDPDTGEIGHNSGFADPEEQRVDDALHTLRDLIRRAAIAAGNRLYGIEYRKSLKAMLMAEYNDKPIGVQEREAYSHPRYIEHLRKMREAEIEWQICVGEKAAAEREIDIYRTRSASRRPSSKL